MNLPEEELIIRYLEGELSPEEQTLLEQRLAKDPALAGALEEELRARVAVGLSAREARKAELKARYRSGGQSAVVKPLWALSLMAVAAAVLLLLWLIPPTPESASPEALFAEFYELPSMSGLRSSEAPVDWEEAASAYQTGDFAQCARLLEVLLADSSYQGRSKALLYLGLCYLELKEPSRARGALAQVAPGSAFAAQAGWYSALAWLQDGKLPETQQALQAIASQPRHPWKTQAEALLKKLP